VALPKRHLTGKGLFVKIYIMERSKWYLLLLCIALALIACGSEPASNAETPPETPPDPPLPEPAVVAVVPEADPPPQEKDFDPNTISQEVFDSTKVEVQQFITDLNRIIRGRNFNGWKAVLSPAFFREISSPEFLKVKSEQPAMKMRNIVLKTPQDYFNNVVVPSRANDRVDDIEFIGQNRVKAFTVHPSGRYLLLYDLERMENSWLIIN
jgi:hypothetical protein